MEQPADVNLAQLQKYLGKSKMVMEATKVSVPGKSNQPSTNNEQPAQSSYDGMSEKPLPDMNQMLSERGIQTNIQVPAYDENMMYEEAVEKSNLPPHIKKLMAEQRIEQPMHNGAPVPKAAMDAMNKQMPPKQGQARPQLNERIQTPSTGNPGFSREEMKSIVKECLSELMMESITENAIKGTLKKMMTEGKLRVKK